MNTPKPRCDEPESGRRCGLAAGHDGTHYFLSAGPAWDPSPDYAEGGVIAGLIEKEVAERADEKPTADDFAKTDFARHPDGKIAARVDNSAIPWRTSDRSPREWNTDAQMVSDGWSPVRACPNPEQHNDRYVSPLAVKRVQENLARADRAEQERDRRDEDALRWKETARALFGGRRNAVAFAKSMQATVKTRTRQRDQADKRAARAVEDRGSALREADRWREHTKAASERADVAEQSRGFTAEDVDESMVARYYEGVSASGGLSTEQVTMDGLRAALTPPPARHPAAERIEALLAEVELDHGPRALADYLASEGVTAPAPDPIPTEHPHTDAPRADWLAARDHWKGGAA